MLKLAESWRKLMFLFRRRQMDRELEEEMRLHAELKAEKKMAAGMDPEQARLAARRQLGNVTLLHEQSRQSWGFPFLESLAQDLRYGARGLRNAPGFSCVAILTLALGIGATTAIFSIVNSVLLRPLPYHDSTRLVHLYTTSAKYPDFHMGVSIPDLEDTRAQAHSLEPIALYDRRFMSLTGKGPAERIHAAAISPEFIGLFSEHPVFGRGFDAEDEQKKNGDVVLLSHALWQTRFGGDPNIVGKPIQLDGKSYTVVGVMRAGFTFPAEPEETEAWVPLIIKPEERNQRASWMHMALAKVRPGVSFAAAQAEVSNIASEITRQHGKEGDEIGFVLLTLLDQSVVSSKSQLLVLLAAVGFLLLIACANVSNLVLGRGLERRREIAVRAALGASRKRIVRQLATESLLLALVGGAAGLVLAAYGVDFFRHFAPADFPRLRELHVEPVMAAFALLISTLCGILCGLAPALSASRSDPGAAMKEKTSTSVGHGGRFSVRNVLVVAELGLALVLITGSGLMVQSLVRLLKADTGLRTDHIVTSELELSTVRYPSEDSQRVLLRQLLDSLQSQPGFTGVALSNNSLLDHLTSVTGFDPSTLGLSEKHTQLESRFISPGYFDALGIRLISGRFFNDHDAPGTGDLIIVNESLARRFFPGQDPIGKTLKFGTDPKDSNQIIGVVSDTRDIHLGQKAWPQVYFNLLQEPSSGVHIMVRSELDVPAVTSLLKKAVAAVDKDQPLSKVRSIAEVVSAGLSDRRFHTWMISAFAASGLILTLIGIYGVISYSVNQRTHEMGIRMALGATRENVLRLVLGGGARLAILGAILGVGGSLLLMRVLTSELYEVKPNDPVTLIATALLLLGVALIASYIPARRATKVDPMVALRYE